MVLLVSVNYLLQVIDLEDIRILAVKYNAATFQLKKMGAILEYMTIVEAIMGPTLS